MAKRTLNEVFQNDHLGLLDVGIQKTSSLGKHDAYIQGFDEINQFFDKHNREPQNKINSSILESKLAVRLESFRNDKQTIEKLEKYDIHGLLETDFQEAQSPPLSIDEIINNSLLNTDSDEIFEMRHVDASQKTQSVNPYTANRKPCEDFDSFKSKFEAVQSELDNKFRATGPVEKISEIRAGQWFILQGMLAYVAQMGEKYEHRKGHHNARLRVIFSNGTESDLLLRSFGAALYKDKSARRVFGNSDGPIFGDEVDEGVKPSGTIYVVRSKSKSPEISKHDGYLYKIGVTSGSVKARIAGAEKDPTYLNAPVELVGEFKLYHMNPSATESLIHKFFEDGQAQVEIKDRFGNKVKPKEWYFVTIKAIREAAEAIQNNTILEFEYDAQSGKVIRKGNKYDEV